jgi:hypothetical protein
MGARERANADRCADCLLNEAPSLDYATDLADAIALLAVLANDTLVLRAPHDSFPPSTDLSPRRVPGPSAQEVDHPYNRRYGSPRGSAQRQLEREM